MELGEILALIVVGALAGTAASSVLDRGRSARKDLLRNTVLGILGAILGGFIFRELNLDLPDALSEGISLADVLVAFVGALLVILVLRILNR